MKDESSGLIGGTGHQSVGDPIDAGELVVYRHRGFWASMDTLKDKQLLEDMLEKGNTPWLPWTRERQPQ